MAIHEIDKSIHNGSAALDANTGFDFGSALDQAAEDEKRWSGTLKEFFDKALETPQILRTSHARIADMLDVPADPDANPSKKGVFDDIIGHEKPIAETKTFFRSAAGGSALKDRILIFVGPPGSGKSSIAIAIKEGLQAYSKTEDGQVFAITGCPIQETPLHAIPQNARPAFAAKLGIPQIEGNLCACCQEKVDTLGGNISSLPVEQIHLSEAREKGIVSVKPGAAGEAPEVTLFATNEQQSIDWEKIYATPSHKANGGILEIADFEKIDEKFLVSLMSVSQEHVVNLPGYPPVQVDETLIGHTNEKEFNTLLAKHPGLKDRLVIINVPYSVKTDDETAIYKKELANSSNVHIAPQAIEMAAMFAVATRVVEPKDKKISLIDKIRLYNSEQVDGFTEKTTQDLREEEAAQREGMSGISPRFIVNALTRALARDDGHCVNAVTALSAIQDAIDTEPTFDKDTKTKYTKLVETVRAEFNKTINEQVQSAFVEDFPGNAQKLFNYYYDNAEAFVLKRKLPHPILEDEEVDPDEKEMRKVEQAIGISENAKKTFREEVFTLIASRVRDAQRKGTPPDLIATEVFTYTAHPKLREAIQKVLLKDVYEVAKSVTTTTTPDEEQLEKIAFAKEALKTQDYCDTCATDMLKYAGPLLTAA